MPESDLRPEIRGLRKRNPLTRINSQGLDEKIFLYRRTLKIFSRNFERVYHDSQIDGITDIWRLSMARFIRKMDVPKKPLFVLDGEGYRWRRPARCITSTWLSGT